MAIGRASLRPTPIISVHIPKTAGKSFLTFLHGAVGDSRILMDWKGGPRIEGGMGPVRSAAQDVRDQWDRIRAHRNRGAFDCIHGHFRASKYSFLGGPMVAWIRDPVERVASHYAYQSRHPDPRNRHSVWIRRGMSLTDLAALPRLRNLQSRYLDVPLDRFTLVGRMERFDEDLPEMAHRLGTRMVRIPSQNVNPDRPGDRYDLSPADRGRIRDLNRDDVELYERVCEVFHG